MLLRVRNWGRALWRDIRRLLWIGLILRLLEKVFEDRILGWINRLLDPYSPRVFSMIQEALLWALQSPLGITGLVFASVIMAFLVHAYFETRSALMTIAPPPVVAASEDAPKGVLDFQVDAKRTGVELARVMRELSGATIKMNKRLNSYAHRMGRLQGNPERAHKLAGRVSKVMDEYSAFLEMTIPKIKETGKESMESTTSYFGWVQPRTDEEMRSLDEYRTTVRGLHKTIKNARETVRSVSSSVTGLRQSNISQSLNRASNRLLDNYQMMDQFYESYEKGLTKLLGILNRKLRKGKD